MAPKRVLVIDDSPTILKVVELTLARSGFAVSTAVDGEAGVAAARAEPPDLILLDFVMPRMNGYQVVRALADDAKLREIPVVLMSAKGDQVGERFVKVLGIVDYITKPFSPEAIAAVVSHTLDKYAKGTPAAGLFDLGGGAAEPSPAADAAAASPSGEPDPRKAALALLRSQLVQVVSEKLKQSPAPATPPEGAALIELIAGALGGIDDERLDKLVADVEAASPLGPEASVLTGDLRVVPIAEVLQLLQLQSQTGILGINRPPSRVDVFFRGGKVDLASATGLAEEFLLGRFIVENELMSRQDLDLMLKSRQSSRKLLGGQLVKLGYLTDDDLKRAIGQQTSELIYEVLRWKFGRFSFRSTRELPAAALDAQLGLTVDGILMEGFRRVDEWHLIEREVDNFDIVFVRNEDAVAQMGRGRLTREELAVLELVNGKYSVKDIVRQSRMSSFDVSKMLYRLLSIKLLRKRVMPVAV